jgi:hypothetical protein
MSMKNSNDTIRNQTHDLPACSAVLQPTAPLRIPYKLWKTLNRSTINTRLIEAIKSLYKGSNSKIKIGNLITKGFKVTKRLRQGCSLSPTLFKIYLA